MKINIYIYLFLILITGICNSLYSESIIIDHTCTDLSKVPESYINSAKANLYIAYGHTSHGSQITSGMSLLAGISGSIYKYNSGTGSLSYLENILTGDLGNPDRTQWADKTRTLLNKAGNDRNLIIWSWCGQVTTANEDDINTYLMLLSQLESDFPDVLFVYMTGHLDGTGTEGNLNRRNEQIRNFCRNNNKILFDFADIESFDPDGNYFLDKKANDNCDYYLGNTKNNWADEWCSSNPGICKKCSCAHSKCLNCMMKASAFWWMLARIQGWNGPDAVTVDELKFVDPILSISPNPCYGILNIQSVQMIKQIKIYNIYGTCVKTITEPPNFNIKIDLNSISAGIYFISIDNKQFKFIRS